MLISPDFEAAIARLANAVRGEAPMAMARPILARDVAAVLAHHCVDAQLVPVRAA
jgi:hypothetical protein